MAAPCSGRTGRSGTAQIDTDRHAVVSDGILLDTAGADWLLEQFLGTARVEVTADEPDDETFVGVARSADVAAYLRGVGHQRLHEFGPWWDDPAGRGTMTDHLGGAPGTPPADADIWVAEATGPGTQVLDWRPSDGDWTVVVMRPDGGAGLSFEARAGVTAPGLGGLAAALLGAGAVLAVLGSLLVGLAVPQTRRTPGPGVPASPPPLPVPRSDQAGQATAPTAAPGAPERG